MTTLTEFRNQGADIATNARQLAMACKSGDTELINAQLEDLEELVRLLRAEVDEQMRYESQNETTIDIDDMRWDAAHGL